MRLAISHTTTYHYDEPVPYGLQELRLHPHDTPAQSVVHWQVRLDGATREASFDDEFANIVDLVSIAPGTSEVTITASGEVETVDTAGVVPRHVGFAPRWLFERTTELTRPGQGIRNVVRAVREDAGDADPIDSLHRLSAHLRAAVAFEPGRTAVETPAEEALAAGHGVCQDHTHLFLAGARLMGFPARYISGYLLMDDDDQEAGHAWAQAWVEGLGWVGFDVANGISPDERYVQIAAGLDYRSAAPVSGVRFGDGAERLEVRLQVQQ
jgi:transglutaminase-like putative cysteine protease